MLLPPLFQQNLMVSKVILIEEVAEELRVLWV